jgi:hypothetical protein
MANPAIAILGSFVSVSFGVQDKAETSRRRERSFFKGLREWKLENERIENERLANGRLENGRLENKRLGEWESR